LLRRGGGGGVESCFSFELSQREPAPLGPWTSVGNEVDSHFDQSTCCGERELRSRTMNFNFGHPRLRRADAVRACGIIRPVRIVEVDRPVRKLKASQRNPACAAQVGAGFHHDGNVRGSGDVETKSAWLNAEAGAARLDKRVPQESWVASKRRAPANGPREVIGEHSRVNTEYIRYIVRRVTSEKNSYEAVAITESVVLDTGDGPRDRDGSQTVTELEREGSDAGNAAGYRDTGQPFTSPECRVPDAGNAAGDRIVASFALGNLNESGLARVEKDSIQAAVERVARIHIDRKQVGAVRERTVPNAGDAGGNRDTGQAPAGSECEAPNIGGTRRDHDVGQVNAGIEGIATDAAHAVQNRDAGQPSAVKECGLPNAGDTHWDRDAGQVVTVIECTVPNAAHAVGNRDVGQTTAVIESAVPNAGDAAGNRNPLQVAFMESVVPDTAHAIKNRGVGQIPAQRERIVSDAGDTPWDRNVGQVVTVIECTVPNAGNAVGDHDAGQPTLLERLVPNAGNAAGDRIGSKLGARALNQGRHLLVEQDSLQTAVPCISRIHIERAQVGTAKERILPNAGDARGNCDRGKIASGIERIAPDAGDGQAVDGAREDHRAPGTSVVGDRDARAIIEVTEIAKLLCTRHPRRGQKDETQQPKQRNFDSCAAVHGGSWIVAGVCGFGNTIGGRWKGFVLSLS
jgi:hypothetical protein